MKTYKPDENIKTDVTDALFDAHKIIISLIGLVINIPGVGGTTNRVLDIIYSSPAKKRTDKWIQNIEDALLELEGKIEGLDKEELFRDEEFVSLLIQATQIAVKTHQEEKVRLLKNSLVNAHIASIPFDIKELLIRKLDKLTLSHLVILRYIQDNDFLFLSENNFENIYKNCTDNTTIDLKLEEFILVVKELEEHSLINLGALIQPQQDLVRSFSVWGGINDQNSSAPYLTINYLGRSVLKLIENNY